MWAYYNSQHDESPSLMHLFLQFFMYIASTDAKLGKVFKNHDAMKA